MDGRSLTGLTAGNNPAWAPDRPIGIELDHDRGKATHLVCQYTGVRASDQVLINYLMVKDPNSDACIPDDSWERYDLTQDPYELNNLCFGGDFSACPNDGTQQQLEQLLTRISDCAGIKGRDPQPRSGHYCG